MRARILDGVGRTVRDGGPYPIISRLYFGSGFRR